MEESLDITEHRSREDILRLMQLLQEYTDKLLRACERRVLMRLRLAQITAVMMAIIATVSIASAFVYSQWRSLDIVIYMIAGAFAVVFLIAVAIRISMAKSRRYESPHGTAILAATLRRLIKLASQVNEHSLIGIGDRLELELRLAEADAVLTTYVRVFSERSSNSAFHVYE
ncbi:MAG: hypothetical protein KF912_06230 [Phycisphaeraceae bacterium]|nr:hypothetical protein [Phycisphaeraceae bacterium]MBX3366897.1 hypothetical protein [Phycisphaeraceae bacterium]